MRVVALKVGFYDGHRRRVGAVFDMKPNKDGKLPKWVKPATKDSEAEAAAAQAAERNKQAAGARAASGGKHAERKQEQISQAVHGAKDGTDLV